MSASFSFLVLQQPAAPAMEMFRSFFPLILIFGIFYFLVIAPARKRQKKLQSMIDGLERGDRVVTTGGIYGEVVSTEGGIVFLKVADNVRLKLAKSAIAGLEKDPEEKSS
jgi:preprotein translocase subunit YajC